MVCKENVVSWFGNLSSYERIDVMCTLLNMCLPFEVRYLGTCVEDLGKRDYNDLRDTEHHANNASDLVELATLGVKDKRTRRKLALYMALLHSRNYACAVIFYKNLSNIDFQEIIHLLNGTIFTQDNQPLEEFLLLYTMALNHPAFTYEQKNVFGNIYMKLQEEELRLNPPKPIINSSYKYTQGYTSCIIPSDRMVDAEIPANYLISPPMQTFHGDVPVRNNTMVSGVLPGLSMPPPGLCLPSVDQMSMGAGTATQHLQFGFPSVNHFPPWTSQVMMNNQLMYHTGDMLVYPPSVVSRQSSPSQSRSPSRSNSPMGHKNNTMPRTSSEVTQSTSNTLTTSANTPNSQTMISNSNVTFLPCLPFLGTTRSLPSQPPLPLPRSVPLPVTGTTSHSCNSSIDNASTEAVPTTLSRQLRPPSQLRSSASADSLRGTLGKEMPNFKGNLQNLSLDEIRKLDNEELRDLGLTSNADDQLRYIMMNHTTNGLNKLAMDKKLEGTNNSIRPVIGHVDNEKQQQVMEHRHNHIRRYPTISSVEPSQMQIYPGPPSLHSAQNGTCYACLTLPIAGIQNRYPRCNAQHVYCLAQLQALKLDPENSRHYSQSSSSDSTDSRSPPETPPAAPWVIDNEVSASLATDHLRSSLLHSMDTTYHSVAQQPMQPLLERQRNSRRNSTHTMRHKNQMVNGGGAPSLSPLSISFTAPSSHSSVPYLPHSHFPTLRPTTSIYSNFSHAAYTRPTYPTSYQPNGELMYQYPGHLGSGGASFPSPNVAAPTQTYLSPTPVVTYSLAVPAAKVSCYNCGSSNHYAADCKDQTMEEHTKRAKYRLVYTMMNHPGECTSSDK